MPLSFHGSTAKERSSPLNPVAPGSNEYVISRPFVDQATLYLSNGNTLKVVTEHLRSVNAFIRSVTLNGKPLPRMFLRHEEMMQGGEPRFLMSTKGEATWSVQDLDVPHSMTPEHRVRVHVCARCGKLLAT